MGVHCGKCTFSTLNEFSSKCLTFFQVYWPRDPLTNPAGKQEKRVSLPVEMSMQAQQSATAGGRKTPENRVFSLSSSPLLRSSAVVRYGSVTFDKEA